MFVLRMLRLYMLAELILISRLAHAFVPQALLKSGIGVSKRGPRPSHVPLIPTWMASIALDTPSNVLSRNDTEVPTNSGGSTTSRSKSVVITNFDSPHEFLDALDENEVRENELLVVKFYANYCKVCQRASISYKKIASDWAERNEPIRFVRLEASRLPSERLRALGLTKFPFVQIFRRGDCVASFSTGPSHMFQRKVEGTVQVCSQRSSEEWNEFTKQFAAEIRENRMAREELRVWLKKGESIANEPHP